MTQTSTHDGIISIMDELCDKPIKNNLDLLNFFLSAIEFRNSHSQQSRNIALRVFNKTHELSKIFTIDEKLRELMYEFGALEAPGSPDNQEISLKEYDNKLWSRLLELIILEKEKRTV